MSTATPDSSKLDLAGELYDLSFYACQNQRYHQILERRYAIGDRATKIAVGVLAAIGFALALSAWPGSWAYSVSLATALASLVMGIFLNVSPIDGLERRHGQHYHGWTQLAKDVATLEQQLKGGLIDEDSAAASLVMFIRRQHELDGEESAPFKELLLRCYEDENERRWGSGIRTDEQVRAAKERRQAEHNR